MQTVKIILLILICAALLSACGLRGPLYLPDENPAKPAVEQDSAAGTDEEENKDDEENDKKKEIIFG
jgi:predicted small lipoprotein YifL